MRQTQKESDRDRVSDSVTILSLSLQSGKLDWVQYLTSGTNDINQKLLCCDCLISVSVFLRNYLISYT